MFSSFIPKVGELAINMNYEEIYRVNGGCGRDTSPNMKNDIVYDSRISFCGSGDAYRGSLIVEDFKLIDQSFYLYTSGYFSEKVELLFFSDNEEIKHNSKIIVSPGEHWVLQKISLPKEELGKSIKIVLNDNGEGFKEWAGISVPLRHGEWFASMERLKFTLEIIFFVLLSFSLTYLAYSLSRRFVTEGARLVIVFLSLPVLFYASFGLYFWFHNIGLIFSYFVVTASFFVLIRDLLSGYFFRCFLSGITLKISLLPILYVIVLFCFSVSYGNIKDIQDTFSTTFSDPLPGDNFLSFLFAHQTYADQLKSPMVGDWLSSDRPPLQAGQFLLFFKFFRGSEVGYQLLSMWMQAYFIIPVLLILNAIIFGSRTAKCLIFLVITFSSLTLIHTAFVWPKLAGAANLLMIVYVFIKPKIFENSSTKLFVCTLFATMAMLSHASSVFAMVPLLIYGLFILKPSLRQALILLFMAITIYGPWMAYQKFVDPPGNRLAKWHLAGQVEIDNLSLGQSLLDAYSDKTADEIISAKWSNFENLFSNVLKLDYILTPYYFLSDYQSFPAVASGAKSKLFFYFFYSMGLIFLCGSFALAILAFRYKDRQHLKTLSILFVPSILTLSIWSVLMYEVGSTIIHQGSYFPWLALMIVFCAAIFHLFKGFSFIIYCYQLAVTVSVYFFSVILSKDLNHAVFLLMAVFVGVIFVWLSNRVIDDMTGMKKIERVIK